jgi:hypothetical protein
VGDTNHTAIVVSNMKKLILITFVIFSLGYSEVNNFFTAQYPDKINYNGKEYPLYKYLLEPYFEKNPEKRPQSYSTALYRGYVGHFEIIENQIFITDVTIPRLYTDSNGKTKTKSISYYKRIFEENIDVKIEWYNGILVLPYGKITEYGLSGTDNVYSNYILIEIKKGVLIKNKNYTYQEFLQFKERQFTEFKKTSEYSAEYEKVKKIFSGNDKKFIEAFIKEHIIHCTSEFLTD